MIDDLRAGIDPDYYRSHYGEGTDKWSKLSRLDERTKNLWEQYVRRECDPGNVLDLGCGRGRITDLFKATRLVPFGVDYLRKPFQDRSTINQETPFFLQGNAFELPFPENIFGWILDYGLFHHVRKTNQKSYFEEVERVLVQGGWYLINVFHISDNHADRSGKDWVRHDGHYDRFFQSETLKKELPEGYKMINEEKFRDGEHVFLNILFQKHD